MCVSLIMVQEQFWCLGASQDVKGSLFLLSVLVSIVDPLQTGTMTSFAFAACVCLRHQSAISANLSSRSIHFKNLTCWSCWSGLSVSETQYVVISSEAGEPEVNTVLIVTSHEAKWWWFWCSVWLRVGSKLTMRGPWVFLALRASGDVISQGVQQPVNNVWTTTLAAHNDSHTPHHATQ